MVKHIHLGLPYTPFHQKIIYYIISFIHICRDTNFSPWELVQITLYIKIDHLGGHKGSDSQEICFGINYFNNNRFNFKIYWIINSGEETITNRYV